MYATVQDLIVEWKNEAVLTQKVLDGLTDHALGQQVYPGGRSPSFTRAVDGRFVETRPKCVRKNGIQRDDLHGINQTHRSPSGSGYGPHASSGAAYPCGLRSFQGRLGAVRSNATALSV